MKRIDIPEELNTYMRRLSYEADARSNLCSILLRQDIKNEAFEQYHQEYLDFYTKYSIAKQELEDTYVKPNLPDDGKVYNWNLDFKTSQVVIDGLT